MKKYTGFIIVDINFSDSVHNQFILFENRIKPEHMLTNNNHLVKLIDVLYIRTNYYVLKKLQIKIIELKKDVYPGNVNFYDVVKNQKTYNLYLKLL